MQIKNSLPPSVFSSRSIPGQEVITPEGIVIGIVQDLVIDPVEMKVTFAIVDMEQSSWQLAERQIAFPVELLEADEENHRFILRIPPPPPAQPFRAGNLEDDPGQDLPEPFPLGSEGNPRWN